MIICRRGCGAANGFLTLVLLASITAASGSDDPALAEGTTFAVGTRTATVKKLGPLPSVESPYAKRFQFDSHENPKLHELRSRYKLDNVVTFGRNEFDRQVILMDWTHHQFQKFGRPSTNARGALAILKAIEEGNTFFCSQYTEVFVSSAASLGWVARPLALRRHQGVAKVGGSTEHSVTEIWSNFHRKWVMLDPTSNMYVEKNGVPLNAYEIRQEWFYQDGTNLLFVIGKEQKKHRKSDLPIVLKSFPGFGELAVHPDELDKYGFIGYIPNTDVMDSGYDYGRMFIFKDSLCEGTKWHVRDLPANPATDPYFPLGQASLLLRAEKSSLTVALQTLTPNFKSYEVRIDGGEWRLSESNFVWNLHLDANQIEARTVNKFAVRGPVSVARVDLRE